MEYQWESDSGVGPEDLEPSILRSFTSYVWPTLHYGLWKLMKRLSLLGVAFLVVLSIGAFSVVLYQRINSRSVPFGGADGNEWLRWGQDTRDLYVTAFAHGMMRGYSQGCQAAISTAIPSIDGPKVPEAFNRCWSRYPISSRDSIQLVGAITEFYKKYPDRRSLNASDILLKLHAGLSIDQIYEQSRNNGSGRAP